MSRAKVNPEGVTFSEAPGLEANQHAKKLAQDKAKKKAKKYDAVFSQKGLKVVKVTVKPNGSYQEYVGSLAKVKSGEAKMLKGQIELWKKEGVWVEEYALQQFCSEQLEKLNK